jgi:hypothetical protein
LINLNKFFRIAGAVISINVACPKDKLVLGAVILMVLRSPSSPTANVSDPKINWVPRGNFILKFQGATVFPDGS